MRWIKRFVKEGKYGNISTRVNPIGLVFLKPHYKYFIITWLMISLGLEAVSKRPLRSYIEEQPQPMCLTGTAQRLRLRIKCGQLLIVTDRIPEIMLGVNISSEYLSNGSQQIATNGNEIMGKIFILYVPLFAPLSEFFLQYFFYSFDFASD